MPPPRLGLLGGTFDPPHEGHLDAARRCRDALGLDRVLLVVANNPWQKAPSTPAADRYAMVEAAVEGVDGVEASRLELDRGGPSYTVETVEALAAGRPAPELALVVGADLVPDLGTWHRVDDLRRLVTLAVVSRPGSPRPAAPGWRVVHVDGGGVDVSSSDVRERLARGLPVGGLVPPAVVRCIRRRGLYAVRR
ncbi:MAG: nicotinate-nucleotide adenylyltransferase [Acidimicrobiales bacterium]